MQKVERDKPKSCTKLEEQLYDCELNVVYTVLTRVLRRAQLEKGRLVTLRYRSLTTADKGAVGKFGDISIGSKSHPHQEESDRYYFDAALVNQNHKSNRATPRIPKSVRGGLREGNDPAGTKRIKGTDEALGLEFTTMILRRMAPTTNNTQLCLHV